MEQGKEVGGKEGGEGEERRIEGGFVHARFIDY